MRILWLLLLLGPLFFLAPIVGAQSPVEEQWGGLIDHIAQLTWAEKNCDGRASDGVRELRLYLRKNAGSEFEEALIKDLTDTRENMSDTVPVIGERAAIASMCVGISRTYGERGSLPGLWKDNRLRPARTDTPSPIYLPRYGQFVGVLSLIDQMKARCEGFPSALAHEFTQVFKTSGGDKAFKERGRVDPELSGGAEVKACEALDKNFGPDSKQWPRLWHKRFRTADAEKYPSASPQQKQLTTETAMPLVPSVSFIHGKVRRAGGEPIAPFSVKTNAGARYFIKLVTPSDNQEVFAGFVVGGQPFSTRLPLGIYELRYAVGQEWLNEQEYFGPKTGFYQANTPLVFRTDGDRIRGLEVELILQQGGNLHTSPIRKDKF
jgi:hypothetical protein